MIEKKHLLKHEFYLAWSRGELSKECLQDYAKEYYHHVKAFPTYLSALHSHTEDTETRQALLQNLIDEEAGFPNHPDLWKNFAEAFGGNDFENHTPNHEIQKLISTFRDITQNESVADGIAALYAYESQIPAISASKIEGLIKFYGITANEALAYFRVHQIADLEHSNIERELLRKHTPSSSTLNSVNRILDTLWHFLTGMCKKYGIAC